MHGDRQAAEVAMEETVERTAVEQFWQYAMGRRRTFLVDRRYQLRSAGLGLLFVVALLVPLNLSVYYSLLSDPSSVEAAPALGAYLRAQDMRQFLLLLAASAVFVVGFFTISLIETHRTAGAAFAIRRKMQQIEQGRLGVSVSLREDDHLLDVAGEFNRMSGTLKNRAVAHAAEIDAMADHAERVRGDADARELASRLRVLAAGARDNLA